MNPEQNIRNMRNAKQHVPPHLLKYGIYKATKNPFTFGRGDSVLKNHEQNLPMPQIELPEGLSPLHKTKVRRNTT